MVFCGEGLLVLHDETTLILLLNKRRCSAVWNRLQNVSCLLRFNQHLASRKIGIHFHVKSFVRMIFRLFSKPIQSHAGNVLLAILSARVNPNAA